MKKIAFVTYRLGGGGAERVITMLSEFFVNNDYDVTIYQTRPEKNYDYNIDSRIKIKTKNVDGKKRNEAKALIDILKETKGSYIISFFTYQRIFLLLFNIFYRRKIIISERNDPKKTCDKKIMFFLRKIVYKKAFKAVFQTDDAKLYFKKICKKNGVVILNPIKSNLPIIEKNTFDKQKIITFCRLSPQKNLPLLIDAIFDVKKNMPMISLDIYGDGIEKDSLIEQINKLNLNDTIKIYPFSKNIHDIAKGYSLYISSSDYEGLSNAMLESMAMGLPSICTDCPIGGAKMVIEHKKNGFLIPIKDKEAMVNGILELLNDEHLYNEISQNSLEIREKLTINSIGNEWMKLL